MIKTLMMGRRSIREYNDENVSPELMQWLIDVAYPAPTGVNFRQVLFTVVDDNDIIVSSPQLTKQ